MSVTVGGTLVSEDTSGVTSRMSAFLAENPLKEGIETKNSGIMGLIEDSIGAVVTAIAIAIFCPNLTTVLWTQRPLWK